MLAITIAGDMRPLSAICDTDYVTALYAAGHMVGHGAGHDIYPALSAENFYHEKFALYTRELLGKPDTGWLYLFSYPAAVAMLCAPFSFMDPRISLACWQVFSILGLLAGVLAFCAVPGTRANALTVFLASCLFLPMLDVVVVGQTSLILGLLPLCLGYYLWQKERYFIAGLAWSVMGLKPQIALPIAVIAAAMLLATIFRWTEKRETLSLIAGLLCGTVVLHAVPSLLLGPDIFLLWLNGVRMSGAAFAAEKTGYWQYHLFCSLPCLSVLCFPKELCLQVRQVSYVGGLLALVAASFASAAVVKQSLSATMRRDLLIILATPIIMVSAPHLLLYDTCLLLLPAWILFFRFDDGAVPGSAGFQPASKPFSFVKWGRTGAMAIMLALNIFLIALLTQPGYPGLTWQLIIVLAVLIYLIGLFCLSRKGVSES